LILRKILFIDLDGVVADFVSAMNTHPLIEDIRYTQNPDTIPGIFRHLKPINAAIKSVKKLLKSPKYDVYFLSTAPWNNPSAWTDKRIWLEEQFGDKISRKLILTHRKDLVKGDILIDDRPNNGAKDFEGKWIHFGSEDFPDWSSVLKYLV
jgi:5'(3')-deoxyribonucleotidase